MREMHSVTQWLFSLYPLCPIAELQSQKKKRTVKESALRPPQLLPAVRPPRRSLTAVQMKAPRTAQQNLQMKALPSLQLPRAKSVLVPQQPRLKVCARPRGAPVRTAFLLQHSCPSCRLCPQLQNAQSWGYRAAPASPQHAARLCLCRQHPARLCRRAATHRLGLRLHFSPSSLVELSHAT